MNMTLDLSGILSRPAETVKEPIPYPNGTYLMVVESFEGREVGEKKTPACDFTCRILQPLDVELTPDLQEQLNNGTRMRLTMWLSENALFRFKEFLERDLQIEGGNRTLNEMLPESVSRQFKAEIIQETYTPKGGEPRLINNIKRTAAL